MSCTIFMAYTIFAPQWAGIRTYENIRLRRKKNRKKNTIVLQLILLAAGLGVQLIFLIIKKYLWVWADLISNLQQSPLSYKHALVFVSSLHWLFNNKEVRQGKSWKKKITFSRYPQLSRKITGIKNFFKTWDLYQSILHTLLFEKIKIF